MWSPVPLGLFLLPVIVAAITLATKNMSSMIFLAYSSSLPISGSSILLTSLAYFTSNKEIMGEHVNVKFNT